MEMPNQELNLGPLGEEWKSNPLCYAPPRPSLWFWKNNRKYDRKSWSIGDINQSKILRQGNSLAGLIDTSKHSTTQPSTKDHSHWGLKSWSLIKIDETGFGRSWSWSWIELESRLSDHSLVPFEMKPTLDEFSFESRRGSGCRVVKASWSTSN